MSKLSANFNWFEEMPWDSVSPELRDKVFNDITKISTINDLSDHPLVDGQDLFTQEGVGVEYRHGVPRYSYLKEIAEGPTGEVRPPLLKPKIGQQLFNRINGHTTASSTAPEGIKPSPEDWSSGYVDQLVNKAKKGVKRVQNILPSLKYGTNTDGSMGTLYEYDINTNNPESSEALRYLYDSNTNDPSKLGGLNSTLPDNFKDVVKLDRTDVPINKATRNYADLVPKMEDLVPGLADDLAEQASNIPSSRGFNLQQTLDTTKDLAGRGVNLGLAGTSLAALGLGYKARKSILNARQAMAASPSAEKVPLKLLGAAGATGLVGLGVGAALNKQNSPDEGTFKYMGAVISNFNILEAVPWEGVPENFTEGGHWLLHNGTEGLGAGAVIGAGHLAGTKAVNKMNQVSQAGGAGRPSTILDKDKLPRNVNPLLIGGLAAGAGLAGLGIGAAINNNNEQQPQPEGSFSYMSDLANF